jgi:hypothetical protein
MSRFSIDESGYTGFDLLNEQQRFQGASALDISDEDARRLIQEYFPRLQADELKYSALARRPTNHKNLVQIQREILKNYNCTSYVCDKRFLLILMFLDYAAEPYYYKRGVDFYEDGQNYALASLLYYTGVPLCGPGFTLMLKNFQLAVKEKTGNAVKNLVNSVRGLNWEEFGEALGPIASESSECVSAILTEGVSTDAAMVVLYSLISRMEATTTEPYAVMHDRSKNLLQYHQLLESLVAHKESKVFKTSKLASIIFPLKLTGVTQIDSKDSPAVQLADILIGAVIDATNSLKGLNEKTDYGREIISLYSDNQIIHLFPSLNFGEQKEFRKGTQAAEVVDYFAANFK